MDCLLCFSNVNSIIGKKVILFGKRVRYSPCIVGFVGISGFGKSTGESYPPMS